MTYGEFLDLTTGQVLDIIEDRVWWLKAQQGKAEQEPRQYDDEEAEELQRRFRDRAQRIGWL